MKIFYFLAASVVAGAVSLVASANAQPVPGKVTPTELLSKMQELVGRPVTVEGTLTNAGTNYFTDLRVVLKDSKDASEGVLVQPWLPVSLPPHQSSADASTPTLAEYLGKKVIIKGVLTDGVLKNVGQTKVLRVESAQIIEYRRL